MTWGPGLLGGYDTTFDRRYACDEPEFLAKVMIHESVHACRAAGGLIDISDAEDRFRPGTPGCFADLDIAPFKGDRQCGDRL